VVSSYLTIARDGEAEIEAKRSRFRCTLVRVEDEPAARAVVERLRRRHWDARHHCSAFVLGAGRDVERASDDGEPAGTAGRPILAAIDGQGLDRVAVRVTRWYGGINLGVGGLVRAYGGAAAECLRLAPRVALVELVEAELRCGFALAGAVHALLAAHAAEKLAESFEIDGLRLRLRLPASSFAVLAERVRDASRGSARLLRLDAPTP
jgi:uncharacterized YigZ family protein